jgi:hypothetical protein
MARCANTNPFLKGDWRNHVNVIDQIGQARLDKLQSASLVRNDRHMIPNRKLPFHRYPLSLPRAMSRDFPTSPKFSYQTTKVPYEWAMKTVPTKAKA